MKQGKRGGHGNVSPSSRKHASRTRGARRNFIGKQRRVGTFAEAFRSLYAEDERAAETLQRDGCHRQAVYFFIQTMEKLTRFAIFSEVSPEVLDKNGTTYRERTLTHNLDELLTVLLEVYKEIINDSRVSEQIEKQLSEHVLQGVRFGVLHNDVRYPRYMNPETGEFTTALKVSRILTSDRVATDRRSWYLKAVSKLKKWWVKMAR